MPKIIRPKPIAPGARVVRLKFDDEVWELDAVEYLLKETDAHARNEKRLRKSLDAQRAERTRGADTVNAQKRADNEARDLMIWGDDAILRHALATNDRELLHRVLKRCNVPKAEWATFKEANIVRAVTRRHGISRPTVTAALKRMKKR